MHSYPIKKATSNIITLSKLIEFVFLEILKYLNRLAAIYNVLKMMIFTADLKCFFLVWGGFFHTKILKLCMVAE